MPCAWPALVTGAAALVLVPACSSNPPEQVIASEAIAAVTPLRATATLANDPDDPAIWINRSNAAASIVLGTVKVPAPDGALAVFNLDGTVRQMIGGLDRPNNVDVEYGIDLDGTPTDVAVVTERLGRRLRIFAIPQDGGALREITSRNDIVLEGAEGEAGAPMGIGLYKRPRDGTIFAIVAPKAGPARDYLWQFRLHDDGTGRVGGTFVRRFGDFSGTGEIEAIAVDDELGYVYYADELSGIHKWHADPDAGGANRELALFGTTGYLQDREGIGVYSTGRATGFLVSVDQLPGESILQFYKREGEAGHPHEHTLLKKVRIGADGTDGLEVTSAPLGAEFPRGLLVVMNSMARNFLFVRWDALPIP